MENQFTLDVIGHVHSPFIDKFGIPRQPDLIKNARASIVMTPSFSDINCFHGIEEFSHIWLSFIFHQSLNHQWKPMIRPPRLGGNERVGVFASRAPFRPNNIGLSVVEHFGVRRDKGKLILDIALPDLVHGTPIVDIKPYIAYADSLPTARSGFAAAAPQKVITVEFSKESLDDLAQFDTRQKNGVKLRELVEETLALDPRPAYHSTNSTEADARTYKLRLYDVEVHFKVFQSRTPSENSAFTQSDTFALVERIITQA